MKWQEPGTPFSRSLAPFRYVVQVPLFFIFFLLCPVHFVSLFSYPAHRSSFFVKVRGDGQGRNGEKMGLPPLPSNGTTCLFPFFPLIVSLRHGQGAKKTICQYMYKAVINFSSVVVIVIVENEGDHGSAHCFAFYFLSGMNASRPAHRTYSYALARIYIRAVSFFISHSASALLLSIDSVSNTPLPLLPPPILLCA